jgi:hypothetical protein
MFSEFIDNRQVKAVGQSYVPAAFAPHIMSLLLISVRRRVDPSTILRPGRLGQRKILMEAIPMCYELIK